MNKRFGIIQGRLIQPPTNTLQYFPPNWIYEINLAKKLNFSFIEFFKDRKFNPICPFFYDSGFKLVSKILKLKKFKSYSFCDDFFINNNILKYRYVQKYFEEISLNLKLIKMKIYVLPLYEKSNLNKKNFLKFLKIINLAANILSEKKIFLALETDLDVKSLEILFSKIKSNNIYIVYDTGNRLKRNISQKEEILNLGKKIIHIHIKDKNFLGENMIIGKGSVNFKNIFLALKIIKYKKNFTFETNRGKFPYKTMLNNIKKIKKICNETKYKIF